MGAMDKNSKEKRKNRKPPPKYVGENRDQIAESNLLRDLQSVLEIYALQVKSIARKLGGALDSKK